MKPIDLERIRESRERIRAVIDKFKGKIDPPRPTVYLIGRFCQCGKMATWRLEWDDQERFLCPRCYVEWERTQ